MVACDGVHPKDRETWQKFKQSPCTGSGTAEDGPLRVSSLSLLCSGHGLADPGGFEQLTSFCLDALVHPAPAQVAADDGTCGRAPVPPGPKPTVQCVPTAQATACVCVLIYLGSTHSAQQVLTGPETLGQLGTQTQKQWPMTPIHTYHPGVQRSPNSAPWAQAETSLLASPPPSLPSPPHPH